MSFNDLHNLGPLQGAAIRQLANGGGCFPATSNQKQATRKSNLSGMIFV
jgi:hypothetical protein